MKPRRWFAFGVFGPGANRRQRKPNERHLDGHRLEESMDTEAEALLERIDATLTEAEAHAPPTLEDSLDDEARELLDRIDDVLGVAEAHLPEPIARPDDEEDLWPRW